MSRVDLHFANASCAHCVRLVRQSLEKVDGVASIDVDPFSRRLVVEFDPARVSVDLIQTAMEQRGYPSWPLPKKVIPFPSQTTSGQVA